jgi:Flp pilus assembly protein TadD
MTNELIKEQLKAGVEAHRRGNLIAAKSAYKSVITLDDNNATAHNNLGFVHGQEGEWQEAVNHLEAATRIKPDYATALSNLGQVYYSIGETQKGLEFLERAVAMDDQDPQNWHNLARISLLVGNLQRAEYAWWRACHLQPESIEYSVNLGISIAAQKRFTEAEKIYKSVLAVDPLHFNALLQLGICFMLTQNYGKAKTLLLSAYKIKSKDASLLRHLSLVELTLGNRQQAMQYVQLLLADFPHDAESRLDYALMLLDSGNFAALQEQQEYLQNLPDPSARLLHYLPVLDKALRESSVH